MSTPSSKIYKVAGEDELLGSLDSEKSQSKKVGSR
jgi:hypothetical protein